MKIHDDRGNASASKSPIFFFVFYTETNVKIEGLSKRSDLLARQNRNLLCEKCVSVRVRTYDIP